MTKYLLKKQMIPSLTTDQMRDVDRLMIEKYGIDLVQMMENAGRSLAEVVRTILGNQIEGEHVICAIGKGNNGGGGLVGARHLKNWGARVTVLISDDEFKSIPEKQFKIIENLSINVKRGNEALEFLLESKPDIVVDALIGYGLNGNPRGWTSDIIRAVNSLKSTVVSLDAPSGLDTTDGTVYDPCVHATATLTLALPKKGLNSYKARRVTGELYLADISVPPGLYKEIGVKTDSGMFGKSTIIKLS